MPTEFSHYSYGLERKFSHQVIRKSLFGDSCSTIIPQNIRTGTLCYTTPPAVSKAKFDQSFEGPAKEFNKINAYGTQNEVRNLKKSMVS